MNFNSNDKMQSKISELEAKIKSLDAKLEFLVQSNLEKQQKISQQKLAIELMLKWADSIDESTNSTRRLVEGLGLKECEAIYKQKALNLTVEYKDLINDFLVNVTVSNSNVEKPKDEHGTFRLHPELVTYIRRKITSYLNLLESIMTAWKYEIADRRIIEEEFAYLITETQNYKYYALETYRQACGGAKVYPAIEAFANAVKNPQYKTIKDIQNTFNEIKVQNNLSESAAQKQTAEYLVEEANKDPQKKRELMEIISKATGEAFVGEVVKGVLSLVSQLLRG